MTASALTGRAAVIDAQIRREREQRAVDVCRCGHTRERHSEFVGACNAGTHHCFSFVRDEQASTAAALDVLRRQELL